MLHDQTQRTIATDPSRSYIVEAPAGSGKTEILTQRFLRLLAQVQAPEQIIALTFTRKAANEMRERVLSALKQVAAGQIPTSSHQKMTFGYAQQALTQNKNLAWNLLQNGHRLRIMTIDALCQMLTQAIPLHPSHYANIAEQPQVLYYQAARAYIKMASQAVAHQADLKILLQHLDNRQDMLVMLLVQVLIQRDQWLSPIFLARTQSKTDFEFALHCIEQHELTRFCQLIPSDVQHQLLLLVQQFILHSNADNPALQPLEDWHTFDAITAKQASALASLLLTSTQTLRKGFDHHIGLKRDRCADPMFTTLKTTSKQICETLQAIPELTEALIQVSQLPNPEFALTQWAVLQALFRVLPLLVAHLELAFQEANVIDFTGVAHHAKLALGHADTPSDLALYLDHHIQHLLIDEFQDTSIQQFELITHLIQGWETTDGRTLFVVGDPMQSIYRFRAAEVGLFIRAKTQGIGPVQLQPLQLTVNFRSAAPIVEWVNHHFSTIFPRQDDIESGAVSFHAAVPLIEEHPASYIQAEQFSDATTQAEGVRHILQQEMQNHPESTIAILVRSRSQLHHIMALLRQHHIPFQGIDIDLLTQLPHLRDVWSLTQAYLMPAQRSAWLALLRSPWCGLNLADLLILAQSAPSIYQALAISHTLQELSLEARTRAQYLYQVFQDAYTHRQQRPLVDTLLSLLQQLHLDVILSAPEQEDLEQFWTLLRQFTKNEQIFDHVLFQEQFNRLYSQKSAQARLHIMTIHKSKGLEFDCVILPGLGSYPQNSERRLMRWLQLPRQHDEDLFLISPIKAIADEECRVYNYLERLDAQKAYYESQRLLYVAVTRAKHRLYLLDSHSTVRKKSFRHMLEASLFQANTAKPPRSTEEPPTLFPLYRLPLTYYAKPILLQNLIGQKNNQINLNACSLPRLIGVVTHTLLQWICTYHPQNAKDIPWNLARQRLKMLGFGAEELSSAMQQIQTHIQNFWADPRGQWIAKAREVEHNELALFNGPQANTLIIDRTFTEGAVRWIIDFKTGAPESHHRIQLEQYASLFHHSDALPIRCGLYYLTTLQWIEWEFSTCQAS